MATINYQDAIISLDNNRTVQLLELVEAIEKTSGITADKAHTDKIPGDVEQSWAKRLLGYHPDFNLATGLGTFGEWYQANKENVNKIKVGG